MDFSVIAKAFLNSSIGRSDFRSLDRKVVEISDDVANTIWRILQIVYGVGE